MILQTKFMVVHKLGVTKPSQKIAFYIYLHLFLSAYLDSRMYSSRRDQIRIYLFSFYTTYIKELFNLETVLKCNKFQIMLSERSYLLS